MSQAALQRSTPIHGLPVHEAFATSQTVVRGDRDPTPAVGLWLAAALDELDYGIVLLLGDLSIVHINDAARAELDQDHPLYQVGPQLHPRLARDVVPLQDAVSAASSKGLRRLLHVGDESHRVSLSVVPLEPAEGGHRAVLLVFGKRAVCESLSIDGFARSHGLTAAETRVLVALCGGVPPAAAARQLGVAVSTVRSQIGSIRLKTGAESIRALVQQVAVLPPIKGALRSARRASTLIFGSPPQVAFG